MVTDAVDGRDGHQVRSGGYSSFLRAGLGGGCGGRGDGAWERMEMVACALQILDLACMSRWGNSEDGDGVSNNPAEQQTVLKRHSFKVCEPQLLFQHRYRSTSVQVTRGLSRKTPGQLVSARCKPFAKQGRGARNLHSGPRGKSALCVRCFLVCVVGRFALGFAHEFVGPCVLLVVCMSTNVGSATNTRAIREIVLLHCHPYHACAKRFSFRTPGGHFPVRFSRGAPSG